jgi:anti-sigma-K factor RskA
MGNRFGSGYGSDSDKPRGADLLKDALDSFHAAALAHRNARRNSEAADKDLQDAISRWQDAQQKLATLLAEETPEELRSKISTATGSSAYRG